MPEISVPPNINYCASVLAKAVKLNNETAFAGLHDALGKLFDAKQLNKVEELARSYTELPIHILDTKISSLQSKVEPLQLTVFLNADVGNVTEIEPLNSSCDTAVTSQMNNQAANLRSEPQSTKKKNKTKQDDETATAGRVENVEKGEDTEREIQTEDAAAIEEPKQPNANSSTKRKKKKNKKKLKYVKKKSENEQEKQDAKPQEAIECKTPEEVSVSALDSGIGSCVASGGEDKSSVLSGGTVESNGEHTEAASPLFSFEWEVGSSVVNDYLLTEKVFVENIDKNTSNGEDAKNCNRYEISFGEPFIADTKEDKLKLSSKTKKRKTTVKNASDKNTQKAVNSDVKDTERFEISFGTPVKTSKKAVTMPTDAPEKVLAKPQKKLSKTSTFDYQGAVLFLLAEWNRTIKDQQVQN